MMRILDPTIRVATVAMTAQPAPRPERLAGVTLGLLANGKSNGMVLLDRIADLLRERRGVGDIVRLAKTTRRIPVFVAEPRV